MNLINLFRKTKLNPRLEVMRFAIYGIALGAAYLIFKPDIQVLANEVSCRWSATTAARQMDGCENPTAIQAKQKSAQDESKGTSMQGTSH